MSEAINVISRTQMIIVDARSGTVSVVNSGPVGPAGPSGDGVPGPPGPAGPAGADGAPGGTTTNPIDLTQIASAPSLPAVGHGQLWVQENTTFSGNDWWIQSEGNFPIKLALPFETPTASYPQVIGGNPGSNVMKFEQRKADNSVMGGLYMTLPGTSSELSIQTYGSTQGNTWVSLRATPVTVGATGSSIHFVANAGSMELTGTPPKLFLSVPLDMASNHIEFTEKSGAVDAPPANCASLYAQDNGSGKTQLLVRFATGAIQVIATQP